MGTAIFCTDCMTEPDMHADGSLYCSCEAVDGDSELIPPSWVSIDESISVLEQIRALRKREEDYSRTEAQHARNDLIEALCIEAGDQAPIEVDNWDSNHLGCCGEEIDAAAHGDVKALIHVRTCMGLPLTT